MPQSIWTQCEGRSRIRRLTTTAWRVVEYQYQFTTRKLVDSVGEQKILEELIETAKPPRPSGPSWKNLHFLLWTPFRYPPLDYGSRFGRRSQMSLWYGSEKVSTALAESAYYRFLFLEDVAEPLSVSLEMTVFSIGLYSPRAVDLTKLPFQRFTPQISNKTTYKHSQILGDDMRSEGVEWFRFVSARDPQKGNNVGVFSPRAFSGKEPNPSSFQTWHCTANREKVEFRLLGFFGSQNVVFFRKDFG